MPRSPDAPVVIVGAGPVGVHLARELRRRDPRLSIVVYGRESTPPYNRIRLSPLLAGDTDWAGVSADAALPDDPWTQAHLGVGVLRIDREARCVMDSLGRWQPYATLVLATGSRPRVPDVPGIGQAHVYLFRSLADTERLMARRVAARRVVVLGGGLLGLEAARAMQRMHTEVCVIEHGPHLMAAQLDAEGGRLLAAHARRLGLQVHTEARVKAINGHGAVTGVTLRDGQHLPCDTVIVAAGIVPETDLALQAGLACGRGIRVDDRMHTSDVHILAVGECAEHRGRVYGLLAPGLEQAGVAAAVLLGGDAHYAGSVAVARLKVMGLPVFSLGEVQADTPDHCGVQHDDPTTGGHRQLVLHQGRVVGALAVGPCDAIGQLQALVLTRQRLWPWQTWRFQHSGLPGPDTASAGPVADWPADAIVCNCNGISRGVLGAAVDSGCRSVTALSACTRAGTVCGSCRPLLAELAGATPQPVPAAPALAALAMAAAGVATLTVVLPGLAYAPTAQLPWHWDTLWRDPWAKQLTGFTLLGLSTAAVALGLRKRVARITLGGFDLWRLVHVAVGVLALVVLWAHTGVRAGHHLNAALNALFVGLIAVGAISAGVIAFADRLPASFVRPWRARALWLHILLFWPLPALLGLHVFKTYWY